MSETATREMFNERQTVPASWWVGLLLLASTMVVAVWAFLGDEWGLGAFVVVIGLTSWALWAWGRARVRVADGALWVGDAHIDIAYLGEVTTLTAAETKAALREGRASEWLHLRPWLPKGVRIALTDPADRHTSWLVATREPEEFAQALVESQASDARGARG